MSGPVPRQLGPNSDSVLSRYLYQCLTIKTQNALRPPAVIIAHQEHRSFVRQTITHAFHPLPGRDRYRIASGLSVQRLPPVVVMPLLIVWVTLSGDTRNVLVEMIGFEPIAFLKYRIYSPGPLHHRSRISKVVLGTGIEPVLQT